jgi:hypothetical protein
VTPDELSALADAATENWRAGERYPESLSVGGFHVFHTRMRSEADAQLAALAPDLAWLCVDLGEALEQYQALCGKWYDQTMGMEVAGIPSWSEFANAAAVLAKFAELEAR